MILTCCQITEQKFCVKEFFFWHSNGSSSSIIFNECVDFCLSINYSISVISIFLHKININKLIIICSFFSVCLTYCRAFVRILCVCCPRKIRRKYQPTMRSKSQVRQFVLLISICWLEGFKNFIASVNCEIVFDHCLWQTFMDKYHKLVRLMDK